MPHRANTSSPRAAISLVEVLIATAIFLMVVASYARTMSALDEETLVGGRQADLMASGNRVLRAIADDLRFTGFVQRNGETFPVLVDEGDDREVVFLLPADDDGDGRPDLDADGEIVWGAAEHSFVVVPDGDLQRLERRTQGGPTRVVARNVERLRFDDAESSGYEVPLGCLRVRVTLVGSSDEGHRVARELELVLRPRNGEVAP